MSAVMSVIGSVIGEFVSAYRGLGFAVLQASYSFNTPKMWVYIIVCCALGVSLYAFIYLIEVLFLTKYFYNEKD